MMKTTVLNYADEMLDFIEDLMCFGGRQFQVNYRDDTKQWAIIYLSGIMPGEETEDAVNEGAQED